MRRITPDDHVPPGFGRLERLLDAAGVDADEVPAARRDQLAHVLEGGFRPVARRVVSGMKLASFFEDALEEMPSSWWFRPKSIHVLVTGFGPFQQHETNASRPFARSLVANVSDGYSATYEGLDVTYQAVSECVARVNYDTQPLIVHCGLSADRDHITVERFAHNVRSADSDETGDAPGERYVVAEGPAALGTMLPVEYFVESAASGMRDGHDLGLEVSRDAGDFVCNALYYQSLLAVRRARDNGRAAEALFVHLPDMDADRARKVGKDFGNQVESLLDDLLGKNAE